MTQITEEDRKRIEEEAENRVPELLNNSTRSIGTIPVNVLESRIREVAVANQIEGATAEHLHMKSRYEQELKELERKAQKLPDDSVFDYETCRQANDAYRKENDELTRDKAYWQLEAQAKNDRIAKLEGWIQRLRDSAAEAGELSFSPKFFEIIDQLLTDKSK
jgi:hypothetical protein